MTSKLKGPQIVQHGPSCLSAVLSMLTGIDYEVLFHSETAITTQGMPEGRYATVKDMKRIWGTEQKLREEPRWAPYKVLVLPWRQLQRLYRENYGVKLTFHKKKPKGLSMRFLINDTDTTIGHVVVEFPDGKFIDPNFYGFAKPEWWGSWLTGGRYSSPMTMLPMWVTAKVIR